MPYELELQTKPTYLHAIVTGTMSREDVMAYLEEVRVACVNRGCRALLIEERLDGPRLGALDVLEIVSSVSQSDLGELQAIAYIDVNAPQAQRFAETVAVNRGMPVAVFASVRDAERWFCEQGMPCSESKGSESDPPR